MGEELPPIAEASGSEIDIDLIDPNPQQPRTRFSEDSLEELARSIRVNGVVQPIVVRKAGTRYQIVAGERRWRASQRAELRRIPAVVREVSDEKLLELALVENIQRQELNPIEEANAYRKLIDTLGLTQEMVAERVGKERSVVTTSLRLLKLPQELKGAVENGFLSAGHGRALLTVDDPELQLYTAGMALEYGWSVRRTEQEIKRLASGSGKGGSGGAPAARSVDANVKAAETRLMRRLATNVKILPGKKGVGGKIEIEYYSADDLERVYQLLMNK
jgi:ParB family chromosome partitioning protein